MPATNENIKLAQQTMNLQFATNGTEMMTAIDAALAPSDKQDHVRIVCFLTDGQVGNDMEIIAEVKSHTNARVFSIGIGDSVNRFLLDGMAKYGRGEVDYVTSKDSGSTIAKRFYERVRNPLLTDISINWNGLVVKDVYPKIIPDLFDNKPVIVYGRYDEASKRVITLKGKLAGKEFTKEIVVNLPKSEPRHEVLATLWARTKIDDLMGWDYSGLQQGNMHQGLKDEITELGLKFNLMTQFTSFVAYEENTVIKGSSLNQVQIPIEVSQGQGASYAQDSFYGGSQTEDFTMWGMIQKNSPWQRLINIVLSFMSLYLIACCIDRFFVLRKLRKEFYEQIKAIWKSYF
jgi:Ca-activated chloride channel family protein